MDLQEVAAVVRRRWVSIVAFTLLGALFALIFTASQERLYTAQATVLVAPASGQTTGDLNSGATLVERVVQTYAQLARTPVVLEPVAEDMGVPVRELRSAVETSISSGTTLITISVTWDSPETAADAANAIGDELAVAVADLAPKQSGSPSIVVTPITPAVPPSAPSSPDVATNVLVGTVAGLLLGLGYVALREAFDSRVRSSRDVRRVTAAPVLGVVAARRPRRAGAAHPDERLVAPGRAEDFRRIRTNLRLLDPKQRIRTLVVTACKQDEGRAGFAVNLARTAVESGLRVCLVDADLEHQQLRVALNLPEGPGLADVLTGTSALGEVTHQVEGIDVVHSGRLPSDSGDLLGSPQMLALLQDAQRSHDLVICASAPILATTDAAALGASADGVVLVVRSQRVSRDELTDAVGALEMAGAKLLGIVLNEGNASDSK